MKRSLNALTALRGLILLFLLACMLIFSRKEADAKEKSELPYLIKVNRACNTVTIYEKDEKGKYTVPVKAMVCSVGTGTRTLTGSFSTKEKYRWKLLNGNVWGQYATRIVGGILFHSVYYYGNCDPSTLATKEYNKLGTAASQGCIRLTVADAKWIYDNCPIGTQVIIYDDKNNPGPLGKPEPITLPLNVRWDPTDPNEKNPYKNKMPKITGAKNITVNYGEKVDLKSGVKAVSSLGADITAKLQIEGDIDYKTPGKYKITYTVTDNLNREAKKTITVTIKGKPKDAASESIAASVIPVIRGVTDRVVNKDIDRELVLAGIEASYNGKAVDSKNIEVQINESGENEYRIIYRLSCDGKTVTEQARFYLDKQAPQINGVSDLYLEKGEIPSEGVLLESISVSDIFSDKEKIRLSVTLVEDEDGKMLAVYEAMDEAGNIAVKEASILY